MKTFGSGQTSGLPLLVTADSFADRQTLHTAVAGAASVEVVEIIVDNGPVWVEVEAGEDSVVLQVESSLTLPLNGEATVKVWDSIPEMQKAGPASVRAIVESQTGTAAVSVGGLAVDTIAEQTATAGVTVDGVLLKDGGATLANGGNIVVNTGTGTKIGTAVGQKLGFWNATPVVQPAAAAQAAAAAATQETLTDSTGGTASTTLAAITAGADYAQADATAIKNAIASLAARLAEVKADLAAEKVLTGALRTALVNTGIIKGAA